MKVALFTSNAIRHKFVANLIAKHADNLLTIVECKPSDTLISLEDEINLTKKHFHQRYLTEQKYFKDSDIFLTKTLPIIHKEVNSPLVYRLIEAYKPDIVFVFGSSIIREPLLSLIPKDCSINMHLGLSPYYRGSGTNFWPFINKELEYIGTTLLHIDPGIDTGDIIAHIRPKFEEGDNVHTIGCKTIQAGTEGLVRCLEIIKSGEKLNRVSQWKEPNAKFYKKIDFDEKILRQYFANLDNKLIKEYLTNNNVQKLKLITF